MTSRPILDRLTLEGVSRRFDGVLALAEVSFAVPVGAIVALIGANGAGKTTLVDLIAGVHPPDTGTIRLEGDDLAGLRPDQVCAAGIGRTFQRARPFGALTVEDNVVVGALLHEPDVAEARITARSILALLEMAGLASHPAASLTLAGQKRLDLARALATRPRLLLLDEVLTGLAPPEAGALAGLLQTLNRRFGLTILMTEHRLQAVRTLAHRVLVLEHGEIVADGPPEDIAAAFLPAATGDGESDAPC